ncbi:MAG: DUF2220 family protein [Turicibacter sp.]|nr:DUF2220 family protein [Turicibacter sp.]
MQFLKDFPRKRIELATIEQHYELFDYQELYQFIQQALQNGYLEPVKASGSNGKKPALYKKYHLITKIENEEELRQELLFSLSPALKNDYYLNHLKQYELDREAIFKLSDFFQSQRSCLQLPTSLNERSFQIWQQEKFLAQEGQRLLKNVGLTLDDLNIYETAEPLAYYSVSKETPQNILIIENKDTFYSLRKYMIEGHQQILGFPMKTLIYAGGKKGIKGFQHFEASVEPYLLHQANRFYYFGDLDYEGILIFEKLRDHFYCEPFVLAYEAMLKKSVSLQLPKTKEKQNRQISEMFFNYFEDCTLMKAILESDRYIPQEILTMQDF